MATCKVCNGKKKMPGMGFMISDCYQCAGTGLEPILEAAKDSLIDDKLKQLQDKLDQLDAMEKRLNETKEASAKKTVAKKA